MVIHYVWNTSPGRWRGHVIGVRSLAEERDRLSGLTSRCFYGMFFESILLPFTGRLSPCAGK
jgi:hypothetical protein